MTCKDLQEPCKKGPFSKHEVRFLQDWNLACKIFIILARFARIIKYLARKGPFSKQICKILQDSCRIRFARNLQSLARHLLLGMKLEPNLLLNISLCIIYAYAYSSHLLLIS